MDRDATLDGVVRALRRVDFQRDVFGQRVAIRLGLSDSDVRALGLLIDAGAATAGRLAELMGLTTGAVTRLIDRLEQSGYVRRIPDPADRRRVIVEIIPERLGALDGLLAPADDATAEALARYSPEELALIGDFLTRMAVVTESQVASLESPSQATDAALAGEMVGPLGGLTAARLVVRSWASHVRLRSGRDLTDLYRLRYDGPAPQVRVREGTVSIQYRGRPFDWRSRATDVSLNTGLPWEIELTGGVSRFDADLSGVDLSRLSLTGGTERVSISLGTPRGEVPVRLVGGARTIRIERPVSAALRLRIQGGAKQVELDGERHGSQGGDRTFETRMDAAAADRFAVEIVGGLERIVVGRSEGP